MTCRELKKWRDRCGLDSWGYAAQLLGLSERQVMRYVAGTARIPKVVELACEAIEARLS